jgi:hypothetical protein
LADSSFGYYSSVQLLSNAQASASTAVASVGAVVIVLGALWPALVAFFKKFSETPQTGGMWSMSSKTYKELAESNTARARREAAFLQRTAKVVCLGLVVLGVILVVVGVLIGH